MPAFSIIVPVHNAENTLRRCLDSLSRQRFSDFEVWMVENGSSDRSAQLCRTYVAQDNRFRFCECGQSVGPSCARNVGLDHAKGTFIAFVDSDDYITPDHLEQLHRAFVKTNADVVFFGYHQVQMDGTECAIHIPQLSKSTSYHGILTSLSKQDLFGYTWIKAFRADMIGKKRFSTTLNLMEDEVFACEVLQQDCHVEVLPMPLYYYVTGNPNSLMGQTHPDFCTKLDVTYLAWKKLLAGNADQKSFLQEKANSLVVNCMFYEFERSIDFGYYYQQLAQCDFFLDSNLDTSFYRAVKTANLRKLRKLKAKYRLKVAVSRLHTKRGR